MLLRYTGNKCISNQSLPKLKIVLFPVQLVTFAGNDVLTAFIAAKVLSLSNPQSS